MTQLDIFYFFYFYKMLKNKISIIEIIFRMTDDDNFSLTNHNNLHKFYLGKKPDLPSLDPVNISIFTLSFIDA